MLRPSCPPRVYLTLCADLYPSPHHSSASYDAFCLEFTSGWRNTMHKHYSVLVLTILLTEDGQRCKKKKKRGQCSQSLKHVRIVDRVPQLLGVREVLFCFSSNVPLLWLMSGSWLNPGKPWRSVLWIVAICWHGVDSSELYHIVY